jgi:hypothetical protein
MGQVDFLLAPWPQIRGPDKIDPSNWPATWQQVRMIAEQKCFLNREDLCFQPEQQETGNYK